MAHRVTERPEAQRDPAPQVQPRAFQVGRTCYVRRHGKRADQLERHEYRLTASSLQASEVKLNDELLRNEPGGAHDRLPELLPRVIPRTPGATAGADLWIAPSSLNFFVFPEAQLDLCVGHET